MMVRTVLAALVMAGLFASADAASSYGLPWVQRAPPAAGFSIEPKLITPVPGTKLTRGAVVIFRVEVAYKITGAKQGLILMVPVADNARDVSPRGRQLKKLVNAPGGSVVLEQELTVPSDATELSLAMPLFADDDGFSKTRSSISVLFPVVKP